MSNYVPVVPVQVPNPFAPAKVIAYGGSPTVGLIWYTNDMQAMVDCMIEGMGMSVEETYNYLNNLNFTWWPPTEKGELFEWPD